MAYSIELGGRTIFLAAKAETPAGDYIVYEWNDGIFIPQDDDDWDFDDEDEEYELDDVEEEDFEEDEELDDDILSEEEDEVEIAIREDMETIIAAGFVPQGGVSALITPEYTTCYSQAFFRKK